MRPLPALLLLFLLAHGGPSAAQSAPQAAIAATVESFLRVQTTALPGQVFIEVGKLPDQPRHAACQQWQAFLPAGARAWGRVPVGLRCVSGGAFSFYVSARIRVEGRYVVAARPIQTGQTIAAADVQVMDGELTAQPPDLLISDTDAVGHVARTFIAAQKPLLASQLRTEPVVQAGQNVKIVLQGNGYAVSNEGQALAAAGLGQSVRVRLPNGSVVSATARGKGVVEVR